MIDLVMRFPYDERRIAEAIMAAVAPENAGFVESSLEENTVVFHITGEDAASVRNSADDLLACIKAAEASMGLSGEDVQEEDE